MAMNRIDGKEDLYVGGLWVLRRLAALDDKKVTHILSAVSINAAALPPEQRERFGQYTRMTVDIDDVEETDILIHFPAAVRFIESGLYPPPSAAAASSPPAAASSQRGDDHSPKAASSDEHVASQAQAAGTPAARPRREAPLSPPPPLSDGEPLAPAFARLKLKPAAERSLSGSGPQPTGAVFVHCAMGKSRSVTLIIAYLLWKYPGRFGRSAASASAAAGSPATTSPGVVRARVGAKNAVDAALKWVRRTREMAEPNDGFMRQLEMWWEMGCPAEQGVESHPVYRKWAYQREIDESVACGRAPDRLRFEDEEAERQAEAAGAASASTSASGAGAGPTGPRKELRCKKCRRVLANGNFILDHEPDSLAGKSSSNTQPCPHIFIEPLSWMRPALQDGAVDGRLACPNAKCGASLGRFSWKGFRCSCGGWVTPAFSLQRSKVDEVTVRGSAGGAPSGGAGPSDGQGEGSSSPALAAMGIRLPPGMSVLPPRQNL